MAKGVFIIGTDTDVGKTFITAGMTYILRKNGYNACPFKAVESGGALEDNRMISQDIRFVKEITQIDENIKNMNPYCLKEALSPHLSSKIEGVEIKREKIIHSYKKLEQKYDYIIAEGSGGMAVPIIENKYFIYDLIKDLKIPAIIVARTGVGTINHTVLTYEFAKSKGLDVRGVIMNGYGEKFYEDDNIKTIKNITGVEVLSLIKKVEKGNIEKIKKEYERAIDIKSILKIF